MSDEELQDPSHWDFEHPIPFVREPERQRAIVSVPLKVPEFRRVRIAADHTGEKLATFIRGAALEKADAVVRASVFVVSCSDDQGILLTWAGSTPVAARLSSETAAEQWFEPAVAV